MLITEKINDVYVSSIKFLNQEIDNQNPIDTAEMGIILTKIDIMLEEVFTVKEDPINQNELYRILHENDVGNPMRNGAMWRARVMKLTRNIFEEIMQSSKIPETYENHRKLLENIIKENKWTEEMEFITVGWIETNDKYTWANCKMTKRIGNNLEARMEIFKTKTMIAKECKKKTQLSKSESFITKQA